MAESGVTVVHTTVLRWVQCCVPAVEKMWKKYARPVGSSKYLNNLIEQDHRKVKQRYYPMPGFKTFGNAQVTLSGIELANKSIKDSSTHRRSPVFGDDPISMGSSAYRLRLRARVV